MKWVCLAAWVVFGIICFALLGTRTEQITFMDNFWLGCCIMAVIIIVPLTIQKIREGGKENVKENQEYKEEK
jgi:hypothetical protein